jgi:hypothetical protein
MHLRLWMAGVGTGVLLVLGGLLAGPIESFAASGTPTTTQPAATPQSQSQSQSQNGSATGQNSGASSTTSGDNCPHDNSGQRGNCTNGDVTGGESPPA